MKESAHHPFLLTMRVFFSDEKGLILGLLTCR